ncbi:hypothetical protein OS493_036186 [Desmophyllum pertusum]|uniref:Uncharacterized protein n=1 Tax=Desmophyllum pertusum TaxID=174260 RepID=A0A9W9Z7A4_9CNID|nr:hypothetical protein OS493_036186 [Desmophyllum pertusum]
MYQPHPLAIVMLIRQIRGDLMIITMTQKQDVYDESHSDQAHDAIPLRSRKEIKRNETSQSESEPRHHDNVPLRDSNKGIRLAADREPEVHVVSPTENTLNNWANIIKVNGLFSFLH